MEIRRDTTVNPSQSVPRLLSTGHFTAVPGYSVVREQPRRDWLLFYTLSGSGRIVHMDGPLLTRRGLCVVYPPGVPQDYQVAPGSETWEFQWAHFLPWTHWLGLLSWPQVHRGIMCLQVEDQSVHNRISGALERMCQHQTGPQRQRELFGMNALEEALLWLNSVNPGIEESRFDQRIRVAMDHMCRNLSRKLSLEEIARECGLSPSRLSHLFREQVGLTPVQYLEQQRISRARELLRESALTVSQVSDMVGYESPFYFSRRFSAAVGVSPRAYRSRAD